MPGCNDIFASGIDLYSDLPYADTLAGRNQNFPVVAKTFPMTNQTEYCIETAKEVQGTGPSLRPFSFILMRKFFVFISSLAVLITAEYYFLTEIFSQKRLPVLVISLLLVLLCILVFIRFFKKSVSTKK